MQRSNQVRHMINESRNHAANMLGKAKRFKAEGKNDLAMKAMFFYHNAMESVNRWENLNNKVGV